MGSWSGTVGSFCARSESCGVWNLATVFESYVGIVHDIPVKLCEIFAYDKMRLC